MIPKKYKIACIFYGIGRGLEVSEPSIIKQIINPLRLANHEVSLYYFKCNKAFIDNPRSGDFGNIAPIKENIFDGAKTHIFTESDLFRPELLKFSKIFSDSHGDNYISNSNLLYQLGLLKKVADLVDLDNYERVIVCRDDLFISENNRLNWDKILSVSASNIVVSMWHWNLGISERFFIASPSYSYNLLSRIDFVISSILRYSTFNAELLQKFVISFCSMKVASIDFRFYRVRLGGLLHAEKFFFPSLRPHVLFQIIYSYIRYLFVLK
jgi:hypothetical protein